MSKALEWELQWIDDNAHRYEGPYHIAAVKRFITERYLKNTIVKGTVRYIGNGKPYQNLGMSIGAGWRHDERLFVYRDADTGAIFHREREDFEERMKK